MPVLQVVHRVITRHLLDQTGFKAFEADSGAVTLIQRFGSAANLNIHLHCLVLDGVYRRTDGEPARISWARLLKRVFEIDMEHCPNCGGQLRIIAAILESAVIDRILTHLGLQARVPPRVPARGDFQQAA